MTEQVKNDSLFQSIEDKAIRLNTQAVEADAIIEATERRLREAGVRVNAGINSCGSAYPRAAQSNR